MKHPVVVTFIFLLSCTSLWSQSNYELSLMPVPFKVTKGDQRFQIDSSFYVEMADQKETRAAKAVERFLRRLDNRTHLFLNKTHVTKQTKTKGVGLKVNYSRTGSLNPGENESYKLTITGDHAVLEAETDLGILHGLETFLQLVNHDAKGYFLPAVVVNDQPRFTWRGLLIDVCRHFSPVDVIKRNLDAMAMVKMNVLHLHLSEDQGFRIESKKFPMLHRLGSNGDYYTQEEIKDLISYASDRGIRVMPEFDMPGHATSWMVGYPHLASAPGPYEIEKRFGVFDPTMDPSRKSTYRFLKKFIKEMSALFPDAYFHIGGDENNGKQWDNNKDIRAFMKKKNLKDNHELQNYFNSKVFSFVSRNNKKMVGWDEILQPGLPAEAVIQSWRGKEGLTEAATKGYHVILSNGYYIDLVQPAWKHYINDPLPAGTGLSKAQESKILGGEATMWAELVTEETIDSRIWPRTAAIAERLWSPREVNDIPDMYRRLDVINIQLEEVGLTHIKNQDMMLRRITGNNDINALKKLVEVVEPLKDYSRHAQGISYSTDLPFTRLPDIAFPESAKAREFKLLCEQLTMKHEIAVSVEIEKLLNSWINNYPEVQKAAKDNPALKSWEKLALNLSYASKIGLESLDLMRRRQVVTDEWINLSAQILEEVKKPVDESEAAVISSIIKLFEHTLPK